MKLKNIIRNIKYIPKWVLISSMLTGCAVNTNQNIKPASQQIQYYENMPHEDFKAYRAFIIKNANLEERLPKTKFEKLGQNKTKILTEYADGTIYKSLMSENKKDVSINYEIVLGPMDHPYKGLCGRFWNLDHVGAGYFADRPTKSRLMGLVAITADKLSKEVQYTERHFSDDDEKITEKVTKTKYEGTIRGGLESFDSNLKKEVYQGIDANEDKIITSYEARQYHMKLHGFDSE